MNHRHGVGQIGIAESLIFSQNGSGVCAVPTVLYFYFTMTIECVRA